MEDDQQFCLRWNNHQSTLIQNFDTLLESGTLVDCTLAAEGKYLKAHKVVLSACSPYFEGLLSEHYDKHPVFILKDVKFKELKAMMDYMYRGEVNISQDQLAALLKAAESLQIKGLSESKGGNGGGGNINNKTETRQQKSSSQQQQSSSAVSASSSSDIPHGSSGLTIEKNNKINRHSLAQSSIGDMPEDSASPQLPKGLSSREGSQSPTGRKRKRMRRRSVDDNSMDNHEASNSSDMQQSGGNTIVDDKSDTTDTIGRSALMQQLTKPADDMLQLPMEKPEPTDTLIEPKSEYLDDPEESVEDLTLDDDMNDLNEMEQDNNRAGPSHDPSQHPGLASWHVTGDRTAGGVVGAVAGAPGANDEVFLAAQEAAQAHRDSQDFTRIPIVKLSRVKTEEGLFTCTNKGCNAEFKRLGSLKSHLEYSCGIEPKFSCFQCGYKCKYKQNFYKHMYNNHSRKKGGKISKPTKPTVSKTRYFCKTPDCNLTFGKKSDLDRHNILCTIPPRYKCFYCDYLCMARNDVEYHIRSKHYGEEMRFVDLQEAEGSRDFKSVGLIKFCNVIEQPFICNNGGCTKAFALESELRNHQLSSCVSLPERYKCPYCPKVGRFKCNIIRHIASHKNMPDAKPIDLLADQEINNSNIAAQSQPETSGRGRQNGGKSQQENGRQSQRNVGKNQQQNGRKTSQENGRKNSQENYENFRLKSPKIENIAATSSAADGESTSNYNNNSARYKCPYCEKRYSWKCVVVRHIHIKHPDKEVKMIDLHEATAKSPEIIATSNNERDVFSCSNRGCNRSFNYKANLKHHRLHDCQFKARFKCGYCDHSTNLRFNLAKHLSSIHPNEPSIIIDLDDDNEDVKPFICNNQNCGQVFRNFTELETHINSECRLSEKKGMKFKCGYCGDIFTLRSSLIRHSRNKHYRKQVKIIFV